MARSPDTLEQDRQETLSELDRLLSARQIDPDDHRQRTEVARHALDETELAAVRPALRDEAPTRVPEPAELTPLSPSEERGTVFAFMGGSVRKGSWEPPETLQAFALMGGINLDFREAALLEGTTEVQVFALMGGIQITVPDDIDVEVNGFGFMGGFDHVSQHVPEPGRPLLRIKGLAVMGGVGVKVKPAPGSGRGKRLAKRFRELI
jgi:hypothetical protein